MTPPFVSRLDASFGHKTFGVIAGGAFRNVLYGYADNIIVIMGKSTNIYNTYLYA